MRDCPIILKRDMSFNFPRTNKKLQSLKKIKKIEDRFIIGHKIGDEWYRAMHRKLGLPCTIRRISKLATNSNPEMNDKLLRTMRLLESVSHPNFLQTYELLHDKFNYYIVSESIDETNCSLLDFVNKRIQEGKGPLNEDQVK